MSVSTMTRRTRTTADRQGAGTSQTRRLAYRVAGQLAKRQPVVVALAGYGKGWYVTAVDWRRELFTVRRSGEPIDVSWSAVCGV